MADRPIRVLVAMAYALTVVAGILAMPIALLVRQAGVPLPVHRVVRRLGDAYMSS
ncbi:MAG: hypothetical protein ABEH64_00065 [Salinirussus sp.]